MAIPISVTTAVIKEGSIKAGETTINKGGVDTNKVTIKDSTISITKDGINGGSKQITNVASGASEIIKGEDGKDVYKYDNDTNAANIGDVKRIAGDMRTEINNNISNVTNKVDQIGQHSIIFRTMLHNSKQMSRQTAPIRAMMEPPRKLRLSLAAS